MLKFKISLLILFAFFTTIDTAGQALKEQVIETGPGPEDLVVDSLTTYPRLLIATSSRRDGMKQYGEIEELKLNNLQHRILERRGEPSGISIGPHGIYLARLNSKVYLYVISHDKKNNSHGIIRYLVKQDYLLFDTVYIHPLLVSPNALTVFDDGSFLACNDATRHGNKTEQILGLKRANIIFYDGKKNYSVVADKLGMPAGINHRGQHVYVSCATENKIYKFRFTEGQLSEKELLCKVKGPDNIRFIDSDILVACHLRMLKFLGHLNDSEKPSPTTIFRINTETGRKEVVYSDAGTNISAGSVAAEYSGKLFIGQVFENFLIKASF
ncbi:MAG: hypothetical protein U9N86_07225 [Bacteroidota bacterium]|nr:hypothetical protein [Bacteroidota bacterium]